MLLLGWDFNWHCSDACCVRYDLCRVALAWLAVLDRAYSSSISVVVSTSATSRGCMRWLREPVAAAAMIRRSVPTPCPASALQNKKGEAQRAGSPTKRAQHGKAAASGEPISSNGTEAGAGSNSQQETAGDSQAGEVARRPETWFQGCALFVLASRREPGSQLHCRHPAVTHAHLVTLCRHLPPRCTIAQYFCQRWGLLRA